jgi:hypothetical protein
MVPIDPTSLDSDGALPAPTGNQPQIGPATLEPAPGERSRLFAFALLAGLIAGAASLFIGERILTAYQSELIPKLKFRPTAEDTHRLTEARFRSATLTFTTMGGLLGLAMGVAGGMTRRSAFASARAAFLGLVLGTVAAASTALALLPIFFWKYDPHSGDLLVSLLTHGVIWSVVGGIGGLALGLGFGGPGHWKQTLSGGLAGGAAAAIVYEIVGALAFASDKTDLPVSSSITTRAMAQLLVAILSAVGASLAFRQAAKREATSAPA